MGTFKVFKGKQAYEAYISSNEWKVLRAYALERDGCRCRLCNSETNLEVHHRVYPERFEQDALDNLTTLCFDCHKAYHKHEAELESVRKHVLDNVTSIKPKKDEQWLPKPTLSKALLPSF
jgi:5-methylcytosine-specific restriction endonuclease McrA